MAEKKRAAEATTMEYLGPSDHLVVGEQVYHRPPGGTVSVSISPEVARRMVASGTHHRFRMGGKEIRLASPAEQRGLVPATVLTTPEDMGTATSDAGAAAVVEGSTEEVATEQPPAWAGKRWSPDVPESESVKAPKAAKSE